ncbi:MAG: hypothetical protein U1C12_00170 [Patescibacteria group bacterium]|nr:hypothetical protein [Patescibacteria group bacterium]
MANYQYLTPSNIIEIFKSSKQYTEGLTDNFPEYERIARNKPHASISKELPKTTDGTTASIIRKTPHRVIQQLPTGVVRNDAEDWLSVIAQFIYTHKIIPSANEDYALLQKCWLVVEKFLTYGFCPAYTPFLDHYGYFCSDLKLPYWGDIFIQPGKLSDSTSAYIFMRSWWQEKDIEALIASQNKLSKNTEKSWNVDALKRIKSWRTTKDEKAKTQFEKNTQNFPESQIELITGFQRGVGAKFYTFHVQSGEMVRTKINKDPRGEMPLSFAYGDLDGANPFGRGVVDLVGGMQNLMDGEVQMYQFNRALMLAPPLLKKGNWDKNKAKLAPNVVIDLGSDTNADLTPLLIDSSSLQNFPQNYSLMKSQLINLLASPDTSISAEAGNPGFSKTPAGVKQLQANLSIDDNYVRKQFETWFERWSETAINLFFAERTGIEELQLDAETINKLMDLAEKGKFDPQLISEGRIRINYDSATPALKFEVDASTSKKQDDMQQLQGLELLKESLDKSPILANIVPPQKISELWNALVKVAGVEDPKKLQIEQKDLEQHLKTKPAPPKQYVNYKDAPPSIQRQMERADGYQPAQEGETTLADKQLEQKTQSDILKTMHQQKMKGMEVEQKTRSDILNVAQKDKAAQMKPKTVTKNAGR